MSEEDKKGSLEVFGTNPVPFWKSTKKTLGVLFALAVLGGGFYAIHEDPTQAVDVLQIWAIFSATCLGIKAIGGAITQSKK